MKEVEKHIWLCENDELGEYEVHPKGWYFSDETSDVHGPFNTIEEARAALELYSKNILG